MQKKFYLKLITNTMTINLDKFEHQIAPKIVERGYDYYHGGQVDELEMIEDDIWLATVYGSEAYRVEIHTDSQDTETTKNTGNVIVPMILDRYVSM